MRLETANCKLLVMPVHGAQPLWGFRSAVPAAHGCVCAFLRGRGEEPLLVFRAVCQVTLLCMVCCCNLSDEAGLRADDVVVKVPLSAQVGRHFCSQAWPARGAAANDAMAHQERSMPVQVRKPPRLSCRNPCPCAHRKRLVPSLLAPRSSFGTAIFLFHRAQQRLPTNKPTIKTWAMGQRKSQRLGIP